MSLPIKERFSHSNLEIPIQYKEGSQVYQNFNYNGTQLYILGEALKSYLIPPDFVHPRFGKVETKQIVLTDSKSNLYSAFLFTHRGTDYLGAIESVPPK